MIQFQNPPSNPSNPTENLMPKKQTPAPVNGSWHKLGLWGAVALGLVILAVAIVSWQNGNITNIFSPDDGWPKEPVYSATVNIVDRTPNGLIVSYTPPLSKNPDFATIKMIILPGTTIVQKLNSPEILDKNGKTQKIEGLVTRQLLPSQLQLNMDLNIHSPTDLRQQKTINVDTIEVVQAR